MNHYYDSEGNRYSQTQIDYLIRKAKKQKLEEMYNDNGFTFCEDCKITNTILDCSHEKSVDWCKKNGQLELAWDPKNIKIRCRECHKKHDKLNLIFNLKN